MPQVKNIELAKAEMFTPEEELLQRYAPERVEHLKRLRAMYDYVLSNPSARDRDFVNTFKSRYGLVQSKLYADLALIKELVPALMPASREWHRQRASEMLLETYEMAKARKDTKTMERAASSYGKINRVDLEDEKKLPFDLIVLQPFVPSSDPTILGAHRVPDDVRAKLRKQVGLDNPDIADVDFEPADLEEGKLFPTADPNPQSEE